MFQELIDNITNVGVFTESVTNWIQNISINSVIILIMMIFMLVGAIDKIRGNKKGYGEKLIRFTLKQAHQLGYPAVVLTGSPAYYARFGFESASKHGVLYAGMDPREEFPFFMVKILDAQKAKYLKGTFNGTDTIKMSNGTTYKIEGYLYECGSKKENTYHEQKTSCATVTVDLNGDKGPNAFTTMDELKKIRSLVNRSTKLKDVYTLYAYNDDVAAKAGTVEQFALERFEKR